MRMAQNGRPPRAYVVDVFAAIRVPDARACATREKAGHAAHGLEGAHGRIHAAGNDFL